MKEYVSRFKKDKSAEEWIDCMKNDYHCDSMIWKSHPAFAIGETAYRRGYTHAMLELFQYAENVPPEVRNWIEANFERCMKWRWSLKLGTGPKEPQLPPEVLPYPKPLVGKVKSDASKRP